MEIGGCGFFPDYLCHLEKRGMNFWEEWIRRAPLPDFISFMIFAYEADPEGKERFGKKSEDPDYPQNTCGADTAWIVWTEDLYNRMESDGI